MKIFRTAILAALATAVFVGLANSEEYKETFECSFEKGMGKRPTPTRLVFSVDLYGRSALLHEVEIPRIDTTPGVADVKRDSYKVLSISWPAKRYVFSEDGRKINSHSVSIESIDLNTQEFSIFLDRRTMKAIARTQSSNIRYKYGEAEGQCILRAFPNN
ncbi:hypothetical protein [Ruegeria arenilitoris]|uniref:hypothetical protein n=1 Tax=Ruegeria arenilitoris TaxID=1173585 RepID=UPI00147E464D|nr:hypothetical protein [Ruegeria arenilitoris]